jgi:hypothetical protein
VTASLRSLFFFEEGTLHLTLTELSTGTPFRHVEASTSSEDSFFVELNRLLN